MNEDWKTAPDTVVVQPLRKGVDFSLEMPGSKSLANRVLLLAAMARGESLLSGLPDNDDSQAALSVLRSLGIRTEAVSGGLLVHGCGHAIPRRDGDIDIRSAGTVGRFLPGMLAAADGGDWRLVASEQLARRPLGPLVDALRGWGASIEQEEGKSFPLRVRGTGLRGGPASISARTSSQFVSGLMLSAPFTKADAVITVTDMDPQETYLEVTAEVMARFGARVDISVGDGEEATVRIPASGGYQGADIRVEPDLNSAVVFLALPLLFGGKAFVAGVPEKTVQPGGRFLQFLPRLGARVRYAPDGATVTAEGAIRGGFEVDMRAMAEMALLTGVLAVFADGPTTMTNLGHIRNHESDRLAALADILGQFGVATDVGPDWIRIHPLERDALRNPVISSREDHRVVMAFSLLGMAGNGATITDAGAVGKTFPDFFARLLAAGAELRRGAR